MDSKEAEKFADKLREYFEEQQSNSKKLLEGMSILQKMMDEIMKTLEKQKNLINNNHLRLNIHKEAIEQLNNLLNIFLKQENTQNEKDT